MEILQQEMFAIYFTLKFHSLSGGTEENYEENLVRMGNRLAEIRTRDIPTTKKQYQPSNLRNNRSLVVFVYRTHLFSKFSPKTLHMFSRLNVLSYDSCLQFCILPDARIKNELYNSPVQCQYCRYACTKF